MFGSKCGPRPDLTDFQVSQFSYKVNKDRPLGWMNDNKGTEFNISKKLYDFILYASFMK